ncbi:nitroreductase family deazaflavin-dependent oxidoreductase [Actinoplanes bogorensis]|uniref:Nitroreductase family deazaflavin-dependent oxidoreductase n=1 Tax=Paractinoplanes bogorensis TaxID=1610840 RepID=A0ABS5Z0A5_9ACTN|nr:nitroreductase/quinone reductase family protein [Actinoplanes bogorensis]MBU2668404.1 nitroreductase family deazaflavin-dependent oxidoreductase [Actinoplanes bogorensis]
MAEVRVPPRWVVRAAWSTHRAIYKISGGRLGLGRPRAAKYGTLRLTTVGRRSGQPRSVLLAYYEDGPDLVLMSMNGWGEGHPAWWLNLRDQPDATVELGGDRRPVRARAASGEERARLWDGWKTYDKKLDAYAALRTTEAVVVVLEPRP